VELASEERDMARRKTHTLEIHGKHVYPLKLVERRSLPELEVTLSYLGWDEERTHFIEGKVKIVGAGDVFLDTLPAKLKKMKSKELSIQAPNLRDAKKEAIDWADELIGHFLETGLFSLAVLDADGMDAGYYEYEPELRVVKATVFKGR